MRRLALLGVAALLTGCAHEVMLTPKDGVGPMGRGSVPATLISFHGPMAVDLAGKHYAGEWTLQSDGGFVGNSVTVSGSQVATGTVYGASMGGNGRAYLTEPGGGSISCGFSYNSMSATGVGECRTEAGKTYDMTIH